VALATVPNGDANTPEQTYPTLCGYRLPNLGLRRTATRSIIARLSVLFIIDCFAGGFAMQTVLVPWFHERWALDSAWVGSVLGAANVLAGVSGLVAGHLVKRIGAVNTMVFTHLPSNVLLLLVPLMPTRDAAVGVLLLRFCLSQMDVPARQGYVAVVVAPDERSAAGGVTNIVRSIGVAPAPVLVSMLMAAPVQSWAFSAPFFIAGGLKIVYDVALFVLFRDTERASEKDQIGHEQKQRQRPQALWAVKTGGAAPHSRVAATTARAAPDARHSADENDDAGIELMAHPEDSAAPTEQEDERGALVWHTPSSSDPA
jgi:MFS family permease